MFTEQETFDTVVSYLRKQGGPALERDGTTKDSVCLYLTDDGKSCAGGCLIPPALYKKAFEVGILVKKLGHKIQLVRQLQRCHDSAVNRTPENTWNDSFEEHLKRVASGRATGVPLIYVVPFNYNKCGPHGDFGGSVK